MISAVRANLPLGKDRGIPGNNWSIEKVTAILKW
jgi:hypothetical protein